MTLRKLVSDKKWPREWILTFPSGYRVECRVVSRSHIDKLNVRAGGTGGLKADALSFTFGDRVLARFLPEKTGRVYFSEDMSTEEFCHDYFHEVHHQFIEWTGEMHHKLLEILGK